MARLEARLDDSLDGRLDDMEPLLKLQREASIASPIPTGEPSPLPPSPDEPVQPAIKSLPTVETVSTDSSIETGTGEAVTIENRQGLTNDQLGKKIGIPISTIEKWKGKIREGEKVKTTKYPDFFKQWTLNLADSLWYEIN
jgi:hypothetical protein